MSLVDAEPTLPGDVVRLLGDLPVRRHRQLEWRWSAASAMGSARTNNEDAWGLGRTCFVVADGMGGRDHGALAARAAVGALVDHGVAWTERMAAANAAVCAAAAGQRCGCAVAVVDIDGNRATVVHAGDVRVIRVRGERVEALTVDHNLGNELPSLGIHPSTLGRRELGALTVYLGDPDSAAAFTQRNVCLRPGDRLAIVTDGVHRVVPPAGYAAVDADALVAAAVAAGTTDDATALVVDLLGWR